MSGQITITVTGNLTDDPQLRTTPNGAQVCSFSVAANERVRDEQAEGGYRDMGTTYLRVNAWRDLADNVAQSLRRGSRVSVTGTLRQRKWADDKVIVKATGEPYNRTTFEIDAQDVSASLRYARVAITKFGRQAGQEDPWAGMDAAPADSAAPAGR